MEHPLTKYRIRKRLDQEELGERLGYSGATVSRWESGKRTPRARALRKICEVTGIAAADLLDAAAADR